MSTQFTSLQDYTSSLVSLTGCTDILGALTFVKVAADARVYPEDLAQTFRAHGLPTDQLPKAVSVRAAMSKAATEVCKAFNSDADSGVTWHRETKLEPGYPGNLRVGVYATRTDSEVRLDDQFSFEVDKATGEILTCDHTLLRKYYEAFRQPLTAAELRNLIARIVRGLDPVRILSGTYVPSYRLAETERFAAGLNDIDGVEVVVSPLPAVESVKAHAWSSFLQETRAQLDEFARELSEGTPRESTLQRRLEAYSRLRQKAEAYADLLSFTADDIAASVQGLTTQVEKMLGVS